MILNFFRWKMWYFIQLYWSDDGDEIWSGWQWRWWWWCDLTADRVGEISDLITQSSSDFNGRSFRWVGGWEKIAYHRHLDHRHLHHYHPNHQHQQPHHKVLGRHMEAGHLFLARQVHFSFRPLFRGQYLFAVGIVLSDSCFDYSASLDFEYSTTFAILICPGLPTCTGSPLQTGCFLLFFPDLPTLGSLC